MSETKPLKLRMTKFFEELKKGKKTEWLIVVGLIIVAIFIYTSASSLFKDDKEEVSLSTDEYVQSLEKRLSNVLSNVKGAGKVNVLVTVESGSEIVIATSTEEKTNSSSGTSNSNSSTTIVEKPTIVGNEPIVLVEKLPKIKGVIVVAQGANNVQVRLELLKAVQAVLEVNAQNVEVFVGN